MPAGGATHSVARWYGSDAGFALVSITAEQMLGPCIDSGRAVAHTARVNRLR